MKKAKAIKKIRKHMLKIRKIYLAYYDKAFCTEKDEKKCYLSLCMFRDYIQFSDTHSEDMGIDYYEFMKGNKW